MFAEHTFNESRQVPVVGEGSGWLNVMDLGVFSQEPIMADGALVFPFLIFVCSFIRSSSFVARLIVGWVAGEGAAQGGTDERKIFRFSPCAAAAGFGSFSHQARDLGASSFSMVFLKPTPAAMW